MDLRELQRQRWQTDHQRTASHPPAERPADPAAPASVAPGPALSECYVCLEPFAPSDGAPPPLSAAPFRFSCTAGGHHALHVGCAVEALGRERGRCTLCSCSGHEHTIVEPDLAWLTELRIHAGLQKVHANPFRMDDWDTDEVIAQAGEPQRPALPIAALLPTGSYREPLPWSPIYDQSSSTWRAGWLRVHCGDLLPTDGIPERSPCTVCSTLPSVAIYRDPESTVVDMTSCACTRAPPAERPAAPSPLPRNLQRDRWRAMFGAASVPRWEPTLSYLFILAYAQFVHGHDPAEFGYYFYPDDWQSFLNFFLKDVLDDPQIDGLHDPNIFDGPGYIGTGCQDRCLNHMPARELAAIESLHGSPSFNPDNRRRRLPQHYKIGPSSSGGRSSPGVRAGPEGAVDTRLSPAPSCGYPAADQEDLDRHLQVCSRLPSPYNECGAMMPRFQLRTHTCPQRRTTWSKTRTDPIPDYLCGRSITIYSRYCWRCGNEVRRDTFPGEYGDRLL